MAARSQRRQPRGPAGPAGRAMPLPSTVQESGATTVALMAAFNVWLIEGGEHPLRVIQPGVQGEVGFPVGGVGKAVQAGAVARVRHIGLDPQLVGLPQAG